MNFEDGFSSLELSKRLKELGVRQESEFYWVNHRENPIARIEHPLWAIESRRYLDITWSGWRERFEHCAAFSVAELGEMLPKEIDDYDLVIEYDTFLKEWMVSYQIIGVSSMDIDCSDKTEANARAKMLIWLIENGKVKV